MAKRIALLDPGYVLACVLGIGILSGCATATPYQPVAAASARREGGYLDWRLAGDRWQVTFAGNALTSRETVEGYLLYRAAELTLEQGGSLFEIVRHDLEHEIREELIGDPDYSPWWGYPGWRPGWRYYGRPYGWRSWYPGDGPFFDTQRYERFEARAEIVVHRGTAQAHRSDHRFDASEVIRRLESTIKRPK